MNVGNVLRVVAVTGACLAAAGSATSNQNQQPPQDPQQQANNNPPPPQQMDPGRAVGLWMSNFGAVKIEADERGGGLQSGALQGAWDYMRQGQEVTGVFWGSLRGNVLQFHWQEPNNPPLTGEGYIVFDQQGRQYTGRWWSDHHDRLGDFRGWRQASAQPDQAQYGGAQDGAQPPYPQQPPYPAQQRQPYPQQQQPYPAQQQPYPQQQQPYPQQPQYPQQQQPYPAPQQQQPYPAPQQQPYPPPAR